MDGRDNVYFRFSGATKVMVIFAVRIYFLIRAWFNYNKDSTPKTFSLSSLFIRLSHGPWRIGVRVFRCGTIRSFTQIPTLSVFGARRHFIGLMMRKKTADSIRKYMRLLKWKAIHQRTINGFVVLSRMSLLSSIPAPHINTRNDWIQIKLESFRRSVN